MILESLTLLGVSVAATGGWFLGPYAARRVDTARLRRHCTAQRELYLTFDDGPGPDLTPKILDLLRSAGARATFFPTGFRGRTAPDLLDRIRCEGHALGAHTDRHLHAWHTRARPAIADIDAGYRSLARWIAPDAPFRPPYGKMTLATWRAVRRRGAPLAWWTVDSGDSRDVLPDPTAAGDAIAAAGGGIALLHDNDRGPERERFVLKSLRHLLDVAEREGLTYRTLAPSPGGASS